MDKLLKCTIEYDKLLNKDYIFTLSNNTCIKLFFNKGHFPHLLGLHKLTDITQLTTSRKSNIYPQIQRGNITYDTIQRSTFISDIIARIDNFYDIDLLLFDKVVINFDPTKTPAGKSSLKSNIIFTKSQNNGHIHLCLAPDTKSPLYYPETFIFEPTDFYIKNQDILNIIKCDIIPLHSKKKWYR